MSLPKLMCVSTLAILCLSDSRLMAQIQSVTLPNGANVVIPDNADPSVRKQIMESMMKQQRGGKEKPAEQGKGDKDKDTKKKDDKSEKGDEKEKGKSEADTVSRPEKPKQEPNPAELEAMPQDGQITLQFEGHPWPAMIEWYSRATGREVAWQELPSGFINLRTQRPFTMKETGDLLNRLLLARGFTILDDGDFMQVIKTEGMNPAFVPRVSPQQLATLGPHSFVRVSFQLQRFKADELAKELEAMKSKHGTLVPMTAANRIEAMDTVRNLRDIYAAIDAEQSSGNHAPREFEIRYLRAANVKKKLDEMFQEKGPVLTPQQMQQMQEQQRRNGGNQGKQPPQPGGKEAPKVSIVVNELRNSIIVKTAPHIMVDVAAAVELLDVELTRDTLDIKAYALATRSPQEVSEILNESGALSPSAIVRVDKNSKALLVSGNQYDHFKIEELIKKIDGNPRRFESIRLRRYPALQVATTIENMMGKPKEDDSNRRRRYYSYWDNNDDEDENPNDVFRVTADVENNRLILKCNDAEYEMVIELLTQMGEVMTRSKYAANEVVLDGFDSEDALLERVKELFSATSENDVILPPPAIKPLEVNVDANDEDEAIEEREAESPAEAIEPVTVVDPATTDRNLYRTLLTQVEGTSAATDVPSTVRRNQRRPQAPPVIVRRNAQGKLVIRCDDPAALEKFEEILRQVAPPTQDWVYFKLKHVTALWMKLQLKDFFEEDDESNQGIFIWDYWGRDDEDSTPPGLGDEKKMRFIDDGESTLVVRNASAKQLATVRELIKLYDVAEPPNEQNARFKKIVQIKYSTARIIETTLKDAFRDLLSSNDKAFAQQKSGDDGEGRGRRMGLFNFSDTTTSALQGTSFKGKISFGVDDSTNRLIVTAEGKQLLDLVVDMVTELDLAAAPKDDTRVITVPAGLNSDRLRETLTRMFGPESVSVKAPENQEEGKQPNPGEGQQDRNGRGQRQR